MTFDKLDLRPRCPLILFDFVNSHAMTPFRPLPLLGNRYKQVGAQRRPDLHAHAVGRGTEKAAQAQMLFDPTPEQFDTPSAAVDLRDEQRFELKAIGEEDKRLAILRIVIADSPQRIGIIQSSFAGTAWGEGVMA